MDKVGQDAFAVIREAMRGKDMVDPRPPFGDGVGFWPATAGITC
jgi:hypothetical protein